MLMGGTVCLPSKTSLKDNIRTVGQKKIMYMITSRSSFPGLLDIISITQLDVS